MQASAEIGRSIYMAKGCEDCHTGSRSLESCPTLFTFADFAGAIAFVNRVAEAAEAANHHPDILVHGWKHVRLTLSTHSQGGLTDADFALAAQIDALA
jgi:Pterin-4a-carbinolamine dehydratase